MSSVLPSGLVAVVTACPARYPGKSCRWGLRREKLAPAAAVGVTLIPDGATGGRGPAGLAVAALAHGLPMSASAASRAQGPPSVDLRHGMRGSRSGSATVRRAYRFDAMPSARVQ